MGEIKAFIMYDSGGGQCVKCMHMVQDISIVVD